MFLNIDFSCNIYLTIINEIMEDIRNPDSQIGIEILATLKKS